MIQLLVTLTAIVAVVYLIKITGANDRCPFCGKKAVDPEADDYEPHATFCAGGKEKDHG